MQIRLRSFPDDAVAGQELARLEEEQKQKGYMPPDQEPR
jgi:predicted DNA-binding WGR domain protein